MFDYYLKSSEIPWNEIPEQRVSDIFRVGLNRENSEIMIKLKELILHIIDEFT